MPTITDNGMASLLVDDDDFEEEQEDEEALIPTEFEGKLDGQASAAENWETEAKQELEGTI
jgi:hypothetical protein